MITPDGLTASSLVDLLRARADARPDSNGFTFLLDGEANEATLTYAALDTRARAIGAFLQEQGARGERVLLLYPPGLEYIAAFFGCLYAGAVAVPAYPPDPARLARTLPRLQALVADAQAKFALTTEMVLALAGPLLGQAEGLGHVRWAATDRLSTTLADGWRDPEARGDSLAFLQYTSGSTGTPRGVMLTHANLLHNSAAIHRAFGHDAESRGVIWLPPYHDMGLIGGILQPLWGAFPVVLMSPVDFLRRPLRWLRAVSRYKATTSGGPNFAYDLVARKVSPEEREQLDLSSWRLAFNGAEPIQASSLERFATTFASCGFRREAFYPCYGLAEATLLVSGGNTAAPPVVRAFSPAALRDGRVSESAGEGAAEPSQAFVGCGQSLSDQHVRIVDPESCVPVSAGQVGEIWVSGPSVALGYWNRPDETQAMFGVRLANTGEGPFLRTGDMGFIHGGELFIAGRRKDLIILRGRNHHPHDLERTAEARYSELRPGCSAAFSVEIHGEEQAVLVAEVAAGLPGTDAARLQKLADGIREAVAQEHEIRLHSVVLVAAGTVPKTSSGKIQRHAARAAFLAGQLEQVWRSVEQAEPAAIEVVAPARAELLAAAPEDGRRLLTTYLLELLAGMLRCASEELDAERPLVSLGLDSLMAAELGGLLEQRLGVAVDAVALLEAPTVTAAAELLLARLRDEDPAAGSRVTAPIIAGPREGEQPLSFAQLRVWLIEQLQPGNAAYHVFAGVRLHGPVDAGALQRSLDAIVRRHESLRTTIAIGPDGTPRQRILPPRACPMAVVDLRGLPESEQSARMQEQMLDEGQRAFDLATGPLLRGVLVQVQDQQSLLLLTAHHLVADGWSMSILVRELAALYPALLAGQPLPLPELPLQYADFARWQHAQYAGDALAESLAYWKQALAGAPGHIDLPTDAARPPVLSFRGGRRARVLSPALVQGLESLCQRSNTTLFMALLTGIQVALHRWSGQEDLVIGTVASERRREVGALIGDFTNFLPLRTQIAGSDTVQELLARVRATTLDAYRHAACPFQKIVEAVSSTRSSSRNALYNVGFVLHSFEVPRNLPFAAETSGSLEMLDNQTSELDLNFEAAQTPEGLALECKYSADLYQPATVDRLLGHVEMLLAAMVASPTQRVEELPLLDEAERHQVTVAWNDTAMDYPLHIPLHRHIEAQVERTPDAIAVASEAKTLTYAELNRRANRLARHLRTLGVGPDVLVGIMAERSLEVMVGVLGILKAGGAYVPLDPSYPAERLSFMLADAQAPVLLTQERLVARMGEHTAQVVLLDELGAGAANTPLLGGYADSNLDGGAGPGDLAYMIYTSGSTGAPKGAMIPHRGIVNRLLWMQDAYGLNSSDRVLQKTPLSFDVSVWELFWPLMTGARLVMARPGAHGDPRYLAQVIQAEKVTTLHFVPSMLRAFLEDDGAGACASVRRVICSGEALPFDLMERFFDRLGQAHGAELHNLYGPTEASVDVTAWACRREGASGRPVVSIGRPIANTQIYLLDAQMQPVPVGVPGELYIGGVGVGRGYLRRPELTAEKFVRDPFARDPEARLYRTGDVARYLPDGNIEFLGRRDHQVKLRGFRIELGEIEAALASHPAIREAAVTLSRSAAGTEQLVAYIAARTAEPPAVADLREHLGARLPEFMVPVAFMALEALPLTPSGKLDRRALPAPDFAADRSGALVAPRTPVEEVVAGIFAELLAIEAIGVHDDFFVLGGHSLLATQAVSRIRKALHVDLPLRMLFENPTVAGLAERIGTLERAAPVVDIPPPRPAARDGEVPLSFAQERLWFLTQLEPELTSYHVPRGLRLRGRLDVGALEEAFTKLLERHAILRSAFPMVGERPVQRVQPPPRMTVPIDDLTGLPPEEREAEAERRLAAEGRKTFDIVNGPMLRLRLLRMGDDDHLLMLTEHHLVHDGWTQGVLARDFLEIFAAVTEGREPNLPELPLQYADYAIWQRQWLQGETRDKLVAYWKQRLHDLPTLDLPTDRPRPAVNRHRGAEQRLEIPGPLADALRELSRREGVTLFMTLLAAYNTLIHRYSGQDDLPIGIAIANRRWEELENLIGMLINTLVHRSDMSGDPSFRELLGRVRRICLEDYAHQDLPFEQLVSELRPERTLSHMPLAQVWFGFQDVPEPHLELPGLEVEIAYRHNGSAKVDLGMMVIPHAEQRIGDEGSEEEREITMLLEYNTDLFDHATITRMLEHLRVLLEGIVADPSRRLSELPMLTAEERHTVLVDWNRTQADMPVACLHELVATQAARTPDAVAVVFENRELTYGELWHRAKRLGRRLRHLGVGPEVLVGLCAERSPELVIGMLGILEAGGAYVPLDPAYPQQRVAFILSDTGAPVVVAQRGRLPELPEYQGRLVWLDDDGESVPEAASAPAVRPDNLAYVIYTSGSTGQPKGIPVEHRAPCNLVQGLWRKLELSPGVRVLQLARFTFDASVLEIFLTLSVGGTLYMAPQETLLPGPAFVDLLHEHAINLVFFTPAVLAALPDAELPALHTAFTGGEACSAEIVARWAPGRRFVNAYGPTEAVVIATMGECRPNGQPPAIGRPVPNVRAYVLDRHGQPLPIGVPGELCLAGAGLARGYLSRPELTAEKFVSAPWSEGQAERLYRTGDRARWRPDGTLEFLGRLDNQVKLRGLRIEPGEIEAVLAQHPAVAEAVVIVREDAPGDQRLVAYAVPHAGHEPSTTHLHDYLTERLPAYMVPSAIVVLAALPLASTGKVDRKALPAPEYQRERTADAAPLSPTEQLLAGIWTELLGADVASIGANDSFFALGGHSLMAVRAIARIRAAFGIDVPVKALFEAPTVAALARRIEALQAEAGSVAKELPLVPVPRTSPPVASFAQQRLWFIDQYDPGTLEYVMPAALRVRGRLDADALARAFTALVGRHEVLRTVFAAHESGPIQVIQPPPAAWKLPVEDLSAVAPEARETELQRRIEALVRTPFDLATGPLLRTRLLRLAPDDHVLLVTLHHIVADGWSVGVLIRELVALYGALAQNRPSPLPPLPVQYADFAVWQRQWMAGSVLESQLGYWKRKLDGATPLELPIDRPRSATRSHQGGTVRFALDAELVTALGELGRAHDATLFMTMLAAFQALLGRYSGQDDICVGTAVAGRRRAEVEPLVGLFLNTLVLRTDVGGNPSFTELLGRVRTMTLEAFSNQDVPFEQVVEAVAVERDPRRTPLFQVVFALQNTPREELAVPGLDLSLMPLKTGTAKFELGLALAEENGQLVGTIDYHATLFDQATIERMARHYTTLLRAVVAHPERPVATLPIMTEAEQAEMVRLGSGSVVAHPELCLHELVATQAARTPDAVAVVFEDRELTYGELWHQARLLARRLRHLGVGPEVLVGLCAERSPELVIGMLGIMEAGGAYVPLDPSYPQQRTAFILEDTGAPVVVAQRGRMPVLPAYDGTVVWLEDAEDAPEHTAPGVPAAQPHNLAYVIYTSGSTGQPKGIAVEHRAPCNLMLAMQRRLELSPGVRVLQLAKFTFDASVLEIFLTLASGGTLYMAPQETLLPGPGLVRLLRDNEINLVFFTPAVLAALPDAELPALHTAFTGGEACSAEIVARWAPGRRFVNAYGPTEAVIIATMGECRPNGQPPAIGRPVPNVGAYVLDPHGQPVPMGVPGELYLSGAGLARGYVGQPELTAEKFVTAQWTGANGMRLYRTGDRARWRPDGTLEFLGRLDNQVKLRGLRIELGEIEAVLAEHPAVAESVAIVREDSPGDQRLVAYVTLASGPDAATADLREQLREHLAQRLPGYMVPSAIAVLEALPLAPTGKVDRKALPEPERERTQPTGAAAPLTPVEATLAAIWRELLEVDDITPEDNFFTLGGHSLLAVQAVSRVLEELGVDVPINVLFEAPELGALARHIEALQAQDSGQAPELPLQPAPRDSQLPLSFAQQRLWFLDQYAPGSVEYVIPVALRARGRLDVPVLARAFAALVGRHEVLRTVFAAHEGEPIQVIQPPPQTWELPVEDLSALPADQREAEARKRIEALVRTPFDLATGPLMRTRLMRLAPDEHLLAATVHHVAADGWSLNVLIREIAALYGAFLAGQPSPLPPLPIQYADFAVWQRQWMTGLLETQLGYWKQQLAHTEILELPLDRPRPPVRTFRGGTVRFTLDAPLVKSLEALSQANDATLFMTLMAAWQVLLARYSGQEDICVGTPVAGRRRTEVESLIGLFLNTLVVRTQLGDNPTFTDLLTRVRATALDAFANQDVPFEQIVEALAVPRDQSRTPLFQVLFVLQNVPREALLLPGVELMPMPVESEAAKLDLVLSLAEEHGQLLGSLTYNADLFDAATIERMAGHYATLLAAIAADPDRPISQVPMLTQAERHQVTVAWNDTAVDYPLHIPLHRHIEAQIDRTPDVIAVVSEAGTLTYAELNRRANRLARHLRTLGVGPDVLVGVMAERSLESFVGVLAVLKAGGAYVPLDPSYPAERLSFMMADAQAPVLLTQERLLARMGEHTAQVVLLDELSAGATSQPVLGSYADSNLDGGAGPDDLMYAIYTSGSTGTPKGALNRHRGVVNRLLSMQDVYRLDESERILQKTPLSFDVHIWEMFWPLMIGARVILARHGAHGDPRYLAQVIQAEKVTMLHFVPSMLRAFLEDGGADGCASVRRVFCGGEGLSWELMERFLDLVEKPYGAGLHYFYGASECSVSVTQWTCRREGAGGRPVVSIGRPIANVKIYLLDPEMQPVPIGVPGELYMGGVAVGRGYLRRPELTAEKFVRDPFSTDPDARLYRTGDLARYLPDGHIEFLGRRDHQVKLRGLRIELGEIETALVAHPAIRSAVVVLRQHADTGAHLVAYVVARGEAPQTDELRQHLASRLPDYMVPAAIVFLDALPLTPSGKLNRLALPEPDLDALQAGGDSTLPRTPMEELIAGIIGELLERKRVGAHDDFFALGGHSLLATRVVSRIRAALGVDMPLQELFAAPTVAGIAARVEARRAGGQGADTRPALIPVPRDGALPVSFAQQRLWFLDQLDAQHLSFNIPAAFHIRGPLHIPALEQAFAEAIRRHETLRTTFDTRGGTLVQIIHPAPASFSLPIIDLSALPEPERERELRRHATEEARQPFDFVTGPLLRAKLLRLGAEHHALLVTDHHIVADGWSNALLIREISTLYAAFQEGRPSPLPELPIQYADFAVWQRQWLTGDVRERQLAYWRTKLANVPALELATDRARPPVLGRRGSHLLVTVPAEVTAAFKRLCRTNEATLYMGLLAAFQALLGRWSGQDDFCVGTPIAGRTQAAVEPLIGVFINTLVLRADLSGDPSFRELLARVRREALDAYAHQDVPFEQIVNEVGVKQDLSRTPLFQAMFALQNFEAAVPDLPGTQVERISTEMEVAQLELKLVLFERGDSLVGAFEYNLDLFDQETIARMAQHFEALLRAVAAAPDRPTSALPLLTDAERQLLASWNSAASQPASAGNSTIHQLVSAQAARTPDAVAVTGDCEELTYRELDQQSSAMARWLREMGVEPQARIGLCVERSPEMVIAMLAVLKAGAAYIPIDPSYPKERMQLILEDTGARMLLTQERLVAGLPQDSDSDSAAIVTLDGQPWAAAAGGEPIPVATDPDATAYLIFTSGSTGRPKGVITPHHAVVRYALATADVFELAPSDRSLQLASLSFDASVEEIVPTLLRGAAVVLFPPGQRLDVHAFTAWITEKNVTVINLITSFWQEWVSALRSGVVTMPPALRLVILTGERVTAPALAAWHEVNQDTGVRCLNSYGPTEATVTATFYDPDRERPLAPREEVPIGRPIAGVSVYVLDQHLEPVPVGIPGELYIGGVGVAYGYHGRPDLTAERFIPDPFSNQPGARLYRTGDRARWRPDGMLDFLGRVDQQMKVRGYRIEPGEIEQVLLQQPGVAAAAAVRTEAGGSERLIVYWVAQGEPPTETALLHLLEQRLPRHMIPSALVMLPELPRLQSGKVDRRALAAIEPVRVVAPSRDYVAPETELEHRLAALWGEILGVDRVGLDDNFFDLGGHSLHVIQMQRRMQESLERSVPILELFRHATVRQLAAHLSGASSTEDNAAQAAVRAAERQTGKDRLLARRARKKQGDGQ